VHAYGHDIADRWLLKDDNRSQRGDGVCKEFHSVIVLTGEKRRILRRLPLFTGFQQIRANICNGYNAGVREFALETQYASYTVGCTMLLNTYI